MGANDESEWEIDEMELLEKAIESADMSETEIGISKLVLDKGVEALVGKQAGVWRGIQDKYLAPRCKGPCGELIPNGEIEDSWSNGGYCSRCEHLMSDDDE